MIHLLENQESIKERMKVSNLEKILIGIPIISIISLIVLVSQGFITLETFWNNLTYFILAGIFLPFATLISLRIAKTTSKEKDENYNAKKLNEEVFKKLMRVECIDYFPFFGNLFGFCIPKSPNAYFHKSSEVYRLWFNSLTTNTGKDFDIMAKQIPTLEIGEKFLEKNYNSVYKQWNKITNDLKKLNLERLNFFEKCAHKVTQNLQKTYDFKPIVLLSPFRKETGYFEENIAKIISLFFDSLRPPHEIFNPIENQSYLRFAGYAILGTNENKSFNIDGIYDILQRIANDSKLREKHNDFSVRLIHLNSDIVKFCDELEHTVVHDIDNQF